MLNSFSSEYMIYFLQIFNFDIWICQMFYRFNDLLETSTHRGYIVLYLLPCTDMDCVHRNCASSSNQPSKSHGRDDNKINKRKRLETENLKFSKINTTGRVIVTNVIINGILLFSFFVSFYGPNWSRIVRAC